MSDIRRFLPLFLENKANDKISKSLSMFSKNKVPLIETLKTVERSLIEIELERNNGNISHVANSTGYDRSTLYKRISDLRIDKAQYRAARTADN